jgi:predicted dehydrogenase
MSERSLRFGLVGAGAIARTHADALRAVEGAALAGVADVRTETAGALAAAHGCAAFSSHRSLVESLALDAVIVCTPPSSHAEICTDLLERGIAVLCEKPVSVDLASALRMYRVAERQGAVLTMASKFRYVEDVVQARGLVEDGALGEVALFENVFASRVDMSGRWNSDPRLSGGGVLIDNGPHSVDLIRTFLGPIAEVQAVEGKRLQQLPVEDTVQLFVRGEDAGLGVIDLSWSVDKRRDHFLEIHGSEGTIRVGWRESVWAQAGRGGWVRFGDGYDKLRAFVAQLENFVAAVLGREALRVTPEDAIASVAVIEAAYQSLRASKWIAIKRDRT